MVYEMSRILHRPFSPGPLTIVRRTIFEKVGGYNENHAYNEDIEFSIRVSRENPFSVLPETLYVWSLRRMRKEGTLKVAQQYLISGLPILLFKKPLKYMPGYVMGGHLYDKTKKKISRLAIARYERQL